MNILSTKPAYLLEDVPEDRKWLIEQLWTDEAVGIIGGEPKCCKSFLALSIAVSVASGKPCLEQYKTCKTGKVLLFAAEDALHIVRKRLNGITSSLKLSLKNLDIQVITNPVLRLDSKLDQDKLKSTVEKLRPKLLILDPFVRLHRVDENASGDIAPILASLRELQRLYHTSIIVVHHSKKGAGNQRAGQALRGSSEFHAWGDANLYLRRNANDKLNLSIEHRAAQSESGIPLELQVKNNKFLLKVLKKTKIVEKSIDLNKQIENIFSASNTPLSIETIRNHVKLRSSTVNEAIKKLVDSGKIIKTKKGYQMISTNYPFPANPKTVMGREMGIVL